jgi:hypothetical protein
MRMSGITLGPGGDTEESVTLRSAPVWDTDVAGDFEDGACSPVANPTLTLAALSLRLVCPPHCV